MLIGRQRENRSTVHILIRHLDLHVPEFVEGEILYKRDEVGADRGVYLKLLPVGPHLDKRLLHNILASAFIGDETR